jgi:hypothetical protein
MYEKQSFASYAERLIATLSRPGLPSRLTTSQISAAIGAPWRTLGSRLLGRSGVKLALATLGWTYKPARGCRGGHFVRVSPDRTPEAQEAIGLPWSTITRALVWWPTAV